MAPFAPPPEVEQPSRAIVLGDPKPSGEAVLSDREVKWFRTDTADETGTGVKVVTMARSWRACDVYLQAPPGVTNTAQGFIRVKVYAVTSGARSLVASGYWCANFQTLTGESIWIAGARAVCEHYEVVVHCLGNLTAPPDTLIVTAVGSNEATPVPDQLGVARLHNFPLGSSACLPGNFAASFPDLQTEVVGVIATNRAAGERSLQLHDRGTVAACVAASPQYSFVMLQGQSINLRHNFGRFGRLGLIAFVSLTPTLGGAGAAADDVVYEVLGR